MKRNFRRIVIIILSYKNLYSNYRDNSHFSSGQNFIVKYVMRFVKQYSYAKEYVSPRDNMAPLEGCSEMCKGIFGNHMRGCWCQSVLEARDAYSPIAQRVVLNIGRSPPQNADIPDEKHCRNSENSCALT